MFVRSELSVAITPTNLITLHLLVSERAKCIARGGLLYKNYIVYYNVYCHYCDVFIENYQVSS